MTGRVIAELFVLRLAVARGRLRRTWSRRLGPVGPALEVLLVLGSTAILLATGVAFAVVGTLLITTLAEGGRPALAASAAGSATLVGLLLAALTVVLSDVQGVRLDPRPLSVLPVRSLDRLVADLFALLLIEPAAAVIWPTAAVGFLAASRHGTASAMLAVPAASGSAVLAAALAVLVRRSIEPSGTRYRLPVVLGACILLLGGATLPAADASPWTPWQWAARAFDAAWRESPEAIFWGALLHLEAFAVLALARIAPGLLRALRRRSAARRSPGGGPQPARSAGPLPWSLPRARTLLGQTLVAGLGVFGLGVLVEFRTPQPFPSIPLAGLAATWILVAGPAPLLGNGFGLGGTPSVPTLWSTRRPLRALGRVHMASLLPTLLPALGLSAVAAVAPAGDLSWALATLGLALGLAAALSGTGAACSCRWPWPADLGRTEDPLWAASGSRALAAAVQGMVVAPLAVSLWPEGTVGPAATFATLVTGLAVGAAGWALARAQLRRGRGRMLEALLS